MMQSHDTTAVLNTLAYVKRLQGQAILVKLGGAVLSNRQTAKGIYEDIAHLRAVGVSVVVVHGGGPLINAELTARGLAWEFIDGQRVTTPEIMEVIESVLCGKVNRWIVHGLNLAGVPAVGLSGIEAATLVCQPVSQSLGQVGKIEKVETSLIHSLMKAPTKDGLGALPVIAPVGVGAGGSTFNINADWAASHLAARLGIQKVLFLTDTDGILDEEGQVISELNATELEALMEAGTVKGGMLTKVRAMLSALRNGVGALHVLNGSRPHALVEELFTERGVGTVCRLRSRISTEGAHASSGN